MKQRWVSSLGVQSWMVGAGKSWIATRARALAEELEPENAHRATSTGAQDNTAYRVPNSYPQTTESFRDLIETLRKALLKLDEVQDYSLIEAVDNDMYQLWKELERTMQHHRRSEARFQLKDMFRI